MQRLMYVLLVLVGLAACKGAHSGASAEDKEEMTKILTEREWRYDVFAIQEAVDSSDIKSQQKAAVRASLANLGNSVISFNADNTMTIQSTSGPAIQGSWEISPDGKGLKLQPSSAPVKFQRIEEISTDRVVLSADPPAGFYYAKILVPLPKR